jgi:oxygen-independent coproporphyrinogen-3 oxidase
LTSSTPHARGRPPAGTPVYVHVPFCAAKCHYCDFFSLVGEGHDLARSVAALVAELEQRAPLAPRSVYLGGGTPSYLPVALLRRLLDALDDLTGFRRSASEISVECNPESLDAAKAEALLALGANRLSIGVQSLRAETLALFGRVHDRAAALSAIETARAAGCRNLNVDLIYAVPGQDLAQWLEDLEQVLAHRPEHVSAYSLAFEERTPFSAWLAEGKLERLPEALELEFFWATRERLATHGYEAYEISNFAMSGYECKHNQVYWANQPYAGFGPSAASFDPPVRSANPRALAPWLDAVERGRDACEWREELDPLARLGETWWLGLRTARGVVPAAALAAAVADAAGGAGCGLGSDGCDPAEEVARSLADEGFLERAGAAWRLSRAGLPLADAIARRFVDLARSAAGAATTIRAR